MYTVERRAEWSIDTLRELAMSAYAVRTEILDLDNVQGLVIQKPNSSRLRTNDRGALFMLGIAGSWAQSGLPSARPTFERLSGLITATPERKPLSPWRCWALVLPANQTEISFIGRGGEVDAMRVVMVVGIRDLWCYFALGSHVEYSEISRSAEQLADVDWTDGRGCYQAEEMLPTTDHDAASVRKLRRLILNTTLALGELEGVRRVGIERGARDRGLYPAGDYAIEVPR